MAYTKSMQNLIDEFSKLPGIGPKSAQRIAFYLLRADAGESSRLAQAITVAKASARWCSQCFNLSETELCSICSDPSRDQGVICVVEEPKDVIAVERTREFNGLYHVLQGSLNPIEGIGPDQIKVKELLGRLASHDVKEVIICTNPNIEGEATSMYLARLISPSGITVSRIASGLPVGGDLEYADELTLGRALEGRREAAQ
ncbi:MAG: recombination mediator RecR [Actinomycetota bacterium]|jgi:recombination protein RecR|nr:recombination mediator RecR [Actinomycetota bacterium]